MQSCLPPYLLGILFCTQVLGQGGSSIISLAMAPPGSEGYAMLQSGAPFADGATSTYYNPALLADLERQTGSQLHFTRSRQHLLPELRYKGLYQRYTGFAVALPSPGIGDDLGIGYFQNHVSFGRTTMTDAVGEVIDYYESYEVVRGLGAGLRLLGPLSVGVSAKYFESTLYKGLTSTGEELDGTTQGWAFDAGILLNPRITPAPDWSYPWMEMMPSLGFAIRNLGPDVFYVEANQADPIPTAADLSMGVQVRLADLLEGAVAAVREAEIHRRASFDEAEVMTLGYSVKALFFRFSEGYLDDTRGKRDERHRGYAIELDMLGLHRFMQRLGRWDWTSPPSALEARFPFGRTRFLGQSFRANPRFAFGRRWIDSRDGGIRDGQDAWFIDFSL
ncbi:MAG TPA: hypothetical protein VK465_15070 [Fibrobacteria bacterium]|nr:hypothetical protein [Fibrobacteria bacterium]